MNTAFYKIRKSAGLTQKDVSKKLGVCQSTISMWESGLSNPRLEMLRKIANLYSCNIVDLIENNTD